MSGRKNQTLGAIKVITTFRYPKLEVGWNSYGLRNCITQDPNDIRYNLGYIDIIT